MGIHEFSVKSIHERDILLESNCAPELESYVMIFKALALTEPFNRCIESITLPITPTQRESFSLLYTDIRNIALAELNYRNFSQSEKHDHKFASHLGQSNYMPIIDFGGKDTRAKLDLIYRKYDNREITYEEMNRFLAVVKLESDILGESTPSVFTEL